METASLKIKFKPLFKKKTIYSSKCSLEIVPEVSCLQNLDKLIWRQETNFIEYSIPMTYKVIVQRRQAVEDTSDTSVKTYHSCVDLLHVSSTSRLNFGCGDVTKIISDTFICQKCEKCLCKEHLINSLTNEHQHYDKDLIICPVFHEPKNTLLQLDAIDKNITNTNIQVDKVKSKTIKHKKSGITNADNIFVNKEINTEDDDEYDLIGDTALNASGIMQTVTIKGPIKHESNRWLSLSPICSVNTCESPFIKKVMASKAITCKIYDSQRDLALLRTISSPTDFSNNNQTQNNTICTIFSVNKQTPSKNKLICTSPPEIRVVEYLRYIEKEMLPLKLCLNDIIRKCTALGIILKPPSKQNMAVKTVSKCSGPDVNLSDKNTKSNRVVYSVVFDG